VESGPELDDVVVRTDAFFRLWGL